MYYKVIHYNLTVSFISSGQLSTWVSSLNALCKDQYQTQQLNLLKKYWYQLEALWDIHFHLSEYLPVFKES